MTNLHLRPVYTLGGRSVLQQGLKGSRVSNLMLKSLSFFKILFAKSEPQILGSEAHERQVTIVAFYMLYCCNYADIFDRNLLKLLI